MGERLSEAQAKRLMEITEQLKSLLDMGALGARAASLDSTLAPGALIDLFWNIIFGKSREECLGDEKRSGGVFLLSLWNGHPMLTWHLNNVPKEQIVMLLSTVVAMVGKRVSEDDTSVIDATIRTLEALKADAETNAKPEDSSEQLH